MLKPLLRNLERAPQDRALRQHFAILLGRHRIGDNASAGLEAEFVAIEHQGPNRDRLVHVAGQAEVSCCASVQATTDILHFLDNFHGAHFGGADERTRRETRGKQVELVLTFRQFTLHTADDVHNVAVALYRPVGIDADCTGSSNTSEIVTCEIDKHHMFRGLFRIGQQCLFVATVLIGRCATW